MMLERGVNRAEPADVETLDLSPKYIHDFNDFEYIRLAVLPDDAAGEKGTASLFLTHQRKAGPPGKRMRILQVCPDLEEIDIIIDALKEAKRRMLELR